MINKIVANYDLSKNNTMALSCIAKFAIVLDDAKTLIDDVKGAIAYAKTQDLPLFVLSYGSNVILPSTLNAVVLLPRVLGIEVLSQTDEQVTLNIAGGNEWHEIVKYCLEQGYYGLENLALIPGLVGACPVQNIGAYGVQVSDMINQVVAIDLTDGSEVVFDNLACQFDYRHSIFKDNPNRYLISHVVFTLHKNDKQVNVSYGDVARIASEFAKEEGRDEITAIDVFVAVIDIRLGKLPNPRILPNCGSFFQNPIIPMSQFIALKERFADLPSYPVDDDCIKIPAGWLIDKAGLKGQGVFPIMTYQKQALVLTNYAKYTATQADIKATQDFIVKTVQDKFGVTLVREPVWVE